MTKIRTRALLVPLALIALASTALLGCNAAADTDPTPVTTWWITPASGAQATVNAALLRGDATPTAPADAPTADVASGTPASGGAATTVQVTAKGTQFEQSQLTAAAGAVTIDFENKDAGIVHDLQVFKGTSASGESLGKTKLKAGPSSETLALQLEPGTYFFQCDAHPTTMKGTLTVS